MRILHEIHSKATKKQKNTLALDVCVNCAVLDVCQNTDFRTKLVKTVINDCVVHCNVLNYLRFR